MKDEGLRQEGCSGRGLDQRQDGNRDEPTLGQGSSEES